MLAGAPARGAKTPSLQFRFRRRSTDRRELQNTTVTSLRVLVPTARIDRAERKAEPAIRNARTTSMGWRYGYEGSRRGLSPNTGAIWPWPSLVRTMPIDRPALARASTLASILLMLDPRANTACTRKPGSFPSWLGLARTCCPSIPRVRAQIGTVRSRARLAQWAAAFCASHYLLSLHASPKAPIAVNFRGSRRPPMHFSGIRAENRRWHRALRHICCPGFKSSLRPRRLRAVEPAAHLLKSTSIRQPNARFSRPQRAVVGKSHACHSKGVAMPSSRSAQVLTFDRQIARISPFPSRAPFIPSGVMAILNPDLGVCSSLPKRRVRQCELARLRYLRPVVSSSEPARTRYIAG